MTATQVFASLESTEQSLQTGTIGIISGTTNENDLLPYIGVVLEACQASQPNRDNFRESTQLESL